MYTRGSTQARSRFSGLRRPWFPTVLGLLLGSAVSVLPSAEEEKPPLPFKETPPRWLEGARSAGGRRVALVVGVGKFARHPIWNLDWVSGDLVLVGKALTEKASFHSVEKLEDKDVSREALDTRIKELARSFEGEDNVFVFYWTGHGYLDSSGVCQYFLHYTDEDRSGGGVQYTSTLSESDLAVLLEPLRRSGKTRVIFVADACRVAVQAPAANRRPRAVTLADATIYSTERGAFAVPLKDQSHSVFAESFAASLDALSSKPAVTVGELHEAVRDRMEGKLQVKQKPELVLSKEEFSALRIFDRASLSLGVRVVDAQTGLEIRAAIVKVMERKVESPATLRGLPAGSLRVEVSSPGMIPTVADVQLDEKRSGSILEIGLEPQFEVIEGLVKDSEGRPAKDLLCRLEGDRAGFLRGYHNYEARTDERGRYRFLIPPQAAVEGVTLGAEAQGSRKLLLDLAKLPPRESVRGAWVQRTFDAGTMRLLPGAVLRVADLGLTGSDATMYLEAEKFRDQGKTEDLELAVANYKEVLEKVAPGKRELVRDRIRGAWQDLVAHSVARGRYKEAIEKASEALKDFPEDPTFAEARESCLREDIPEVLRKSVKEAGLAVEAGDFQGAERLYRELKGSEAQLTPYYRDQVEKNLGGVVEKLFQDAVSSIGTAYRGGDFPSAVRSYEELRRLRPTYGALKAWQTRLEKHLDGERPTIEILGAGGVAVGAGPIETGEEVFRFKVSARDNKALGSVKVNGEERLRTPGDGAAFSEELQVPLTKGDNRIEVEVVDLAGLEAEAQVVVRRLDSKAIAGFTFVAKNAEGYPEYRHEQTGAIFVLLPGGKFSMGSPPGETGRDDDEGPVHEVTLSAFLIAKHEMTQGVWEKVMGSNPSNFKQGKDYPVEQVSWEDCQSFCRKTGLKLPSEAQWEYACRAGTSTAIYTGPLRILGQNNGPELDPIAWYGGNSGVTYAGGVDSSGWPEKQTNHTKAGTHPVGQKKPNSFGLYDMHGNVWEWCEDVWDSGFYGKSEARGPDPVSTAGSGLRVRRGGSWGNGAGNCRSARRYGNGPADRDVNLGFRPAFPLP